MRKEGAARHTELLRKLVHVGSGVIALALAWLTWQQALALAACALAFNAFVLPRIGGKALQREEELRRGHAFGILMYPASVIVLVLAFRERLEFVAIGWALMAFGDGMASVVGSAIGRRPLPWNEGKSWEGLVAHGIFGWGAALAIGSFVAQAHGREIALPELAVAIGLSALVTAFIETIDSGVDDNILVPLLGAGLCFVALHVTSSIPQGAFTDERILPRAGIAMLACGLLAISAWWRGMLTVAGSIGAAILGVLVAAAAGWGMFAALCAFFAIGVVATRVGRRVKESRGIAEARGGRRGLGNVVANGGMAGLLAILTHESGFFGHVGQHFLPMLCGMAALATAAFDTVSSEIGKAYGRRTFLPTTLRAVSPGTEGAISMEGTLAGVVAAAVVAAVSLPIAAATMFWPMRDAPSHLASLGLAIVVAAFVGSMFESVVGALCHDRGHRVQNDFMNFANTVVGAAALALIVACRFPAEFS